MDGNLVQLLNRSPPHGLPEIGILRNSVRSFSYRRCYVLSDSPPKNLQEPKSTRESISVSRAPMLDASTSWSGSQCRLFNVRGHLQCKQLRSTSNVKNIFSNCSGRFGSKLPGLRVKPGRFACVAPRQAFSGDDLGDLTRSVDIAPLYENWNKLVSSVPSWETLREGLDNLGQSPASVLSRGSLLADSVATSSGDAALQSQQDVQEKLSLLEQAAGTILDKGSEIRQYVETTFGEVTLPSGQDVQDEFGHLGESASTILSAGSEILQRVATTLVGVTLPTSEVLQEGLDRLEQSAGTVLAKASGVLENVALKSEDGLLPSLHPQLFRQMPSNNVNTPALEQLSQSASKLAASASALTSELVTKLNHLSGNVLNVDSTALAHTAGQRLSQFEDAVGDYYQSLGASAVPVTVIAVVTVTGSVVAMLSYKSGRGSRRLLEEDDLPLRYDPEAIKSYFKKRPLDIFSRSLSIMSQCSALTISILFDLFLGRAKENEPRRAAQLVDLIARLGPTAIKIGQALSIRPDLLPVAYLEELQKLQDRVPPFPNEEAKVLIFLELGKTAEEVFSEISESPVAAASLGQVYKGKLRDTGETVAIKVQRPGVLEGISRDLFLLRVAAYSLKSIPLIQSDLVALLDTWAIRFFDELDYVQEGKNAVEFADNMKALTNVTVPAVYMPYTSRKVLTTQWIEGEKLSESKTDDLLPLITTALNCYLVQLLEKGFLHADPHPGNLLRTTDGRLCVLDFGLMTQVTEDQRYALVEYISHLVNSDYAKVAQDLVNLGFVPPHLEDPEKTAAVVPQLSRILGQLVQGGGARKINIQQVTEDLSNIAKDYVFVLPPYFALILRAFSVLEGIGLEADPDYTIVDECYPYISKRLLTDDSPRTRAALKDFLYGGKGQLDMQRVEDIVGGFQSFREVMAPKQLNGRQPQKSQVMDRTTKEALMLIFAPEGSYIQELLLTELVRSVDALSREAVAQVWQLIASAMRIPGFPFPPPFSVPGSWPLPVPGLFFGNAPVARLSAEDEQSLDTVKRIWKLLQPGFGLPLSSDIAEIVEDLVPLLFNLFPGVTTAAQRFNAMLLQRLALRFADDLDGTNSVLEWNRDPMASARHIQPLRIFNLLSFPRDRS